MSMAAACRRSRKIVRRIDGEQVMQAIPLAQGCQIYLIHEGEGRAAIPPCVGGTGHESTELIEFIASQKAQLPNLSVRSVEPLLACPSLPTPTGISGRIDDSLPMLARVDRSERLRYMIGEAKLMSLTWMAAEEGVSLCWKMPTTSRISGEPPISTLPAALPDRANARGLES